MKFDVITIFPDIFKGFLSESIIKKAKEKGLIEINIHDLRKFTRDRHKTVDDKPFGGGRGMVLKVEPIYSAVSSIKVRKKQKRKIILLSPRGKKFDQKLAHRFSKLSHLVMICGRYEGVDERVAKYIADESISIGDYVLMGGELPAMVVIEAVSRLIPDVVGKSELLNERIPRTKGRGGRGFIEFPQYTRPEVFTPPKGTKWRVPKVLLSGNHKEIEEWRKKHSKLIEK